MFRLGPAGVHWGAVSSPISQQMARRSASRHSFPQTALGRDTSLSHKLSHARILNRVRGTAMIFERGREHRARSGGGKG